MYTLTCAYTYADASTIVTYVTTSHLIWITASLLSEKNNKNSEETTLLLNCFVWVSLREDNLRVPRKRVTIEVLTDVHVARVMTVTEFNSVIFDKRTVIKDLCYNWKVHVTHTHKLIVKHVIKILYSPWAKNKLRRSKMIQERMNKRREQDKGNKIRASLDVRPPS